MQNRIQIFLHPFTAWPHNQSTIHNTHHCNAENWLSSLMFDDLFCCWFVFHDAEDFNPVFTISNPLCVLHKQISLNACSINWVRKTYTVSFAAASSEGKSSSLLISGACCFFALRKEMGAMFPADPDILPNKNSFWRHLANKCTQILWVNLLFVDALLSTLTVSSRTKIVQWKLER